MNENERDLPDNEELVRMMHDEEFLKENGYRITPKGYMALVLMEHGFPNIVAEALSQVMSDRIFAAGYTYVDEQTLGIELDLDGGLE